MCPIVTDEAIDAIPQRPMIIDLAEKPDIEKLSKTSDTVNSGMGPGKDAILIEVVGEKVVFRKTGFHNINTNKNVCVSCQYKQKSMKMYVSYKC